MVTGLSPERPDEALMVKIAGIILQLTAERESNKGRVENQCGEVVQKLIARWLKHHKFGEREINKMFHIIQRHNTKKEKRLVLVRPLFFTRLGSHSGVCKANPSEYALPVNVPNSGTLVRLPGWTRRGQAHKCEVSDDWSDRYSAIGRHKRLVPERMWRSQRKAITHWASCGWRCAEVAYFLVFREAIIKHYMLEGLTR